MSPSIIVAFDESDPAKRALETALTEFVDPEVIVVHVIDPMEFIETASIEDGQPAASGPEHRRKGERLIEEAESIAKSHAIPIEAMLRTGDVAREVTYLADELPADHIVLGSHGRTGIDRLLLGSVAEKVMRRAPVPVTIVR